MRLIQKKLTLVTAHKFADRFGRLLSVDQVPRVCSRDGDGGLFELQHADSSVRYEVSGVVSHVEFYSEHQVESFGLRLAFTDYPATCLVTLNRDLFCIPVVREYLRDHGLEDRVRGEWLFDLTVPAGAPIPITEE